MFSVEKKKRKKKKKEKKEEEEEEEGMPPSVIPSHFNSQSSACTLTALDGLCV